MSESIPVAPVRIPRKLAPVYLAERWAYRVTAGTLGQYAHMGRGPKHVLVRGRAFYEPCDLDAWIIASTRPSK
jgi:hypothetical protein